MGKLIQTDQIEVIDHDTFNHKSMLCSSRIKWGDWRNWEKYYSTILFFIIGDLFYNFIFFDYPMWRFFDGNPPIFGYDKFIVFSFIFFRYPATVLIYLGKFPKGLRKGIIWFSFWVLLYFSIEVVKTYIGIVDHFNGWSLGWSFIFDIIIFTMIKLHFHRPLIAWVVGLILAIILWIILDVPLNILNFK